jgi:hypothetical protein
MNWTTIFTIGVAMASISFVLIAFILFQHFNRYLIRSGTFADYGSAISYGVFVISIFQTLWVCIHRYAYFQAACSYEAYDYSWRLVVLIPLMVASLGCIFYFQLRLKAPDYLIFEEGQKTNIVYTEMNVKTVQVERNRNSADGGSVGSRGSKVGSIEVEDNKLNVLGEVEENFEFDKEKEKTCSCCTFNEVIYYGKYGCNCNSRCTLLAILLGLLVIMCYGSYLAWLSKKTALYQMVRKRSLFPNAMILFHPSFFPSLQGEGGV